MAGCIPQADVSNKKYESYSIVGVQQIDQIVNAVETTLLGNRIRITRDKKTNDTGLKRKAGGAKLDMPKIRKNPFVEIIPINTGCLNQCTYCKTKHARGDLGSYTPSEIYARVESVLDEGVVEIWLTSEDLGAYGIDIGETITGLCF